MREESRSRADKIELEDEFVKIPVDSFVEMSQEGSTCKSCSQAVCATCSVVPSNTKSQITNKVAHFGGGRIRSNVFTKFVVPRVKVVYDIYLRTTDFKSIALFYQNVKNHCSM